MHLMSLKNIVWKMLKKLMKVKIMECVNIGWIEIERRKHAVQYAQKMVAISLKEKRKRKEKDGKECTESIFERTA